MTPSIETRAFPAHLTADVEAVVPALSDGQLHPPSNAFRVVVREEPLEIPYRVYYKEGRALECAELAGVQGHIALALGTRHHNGFLRERCVRRLIARGEPWVVPFVIQLVGEYVLKILQVIEHELPALDKHLYGEFLNANAAHYQTICRRTVSYWNEYYRGEYLQWKDYPGHRVLTALTSFAESSTTSPLP